MSQWAHYSEVDPEWAEEAGKKPYSIMTDIPTRRVQMAKSLKARMETAEYPSERALDACRYGILLSLRHITETGLIISERSIAVEGGEILIRIYVPEPTGPAAERYPILVYLRGNHTFRYSYELIKY